MCCVCVWVSENMNRMRVTKTMCVSYVCVCRLDNVLLIHCKAMPQRDRLQGHSKVGVRVAAWHRSVYPQPRTSHNSTQITDMTEPQSKGQHEGKEALSHDHKDTTKPSAISPESLTSCGPLPSEEEAVYFTTMACIQGGNSCPSVKEDLIYFS